MCIGRTHYAQASSVATVLWACARLYRGLWPAVSWPCRRPGLQCRKHGRTPCRRAPERVAACRVAAPAPCLEPPYAVSWHAAVLYSSVVPSYRDPKSPPQPRYKYLYRDPTPLRAHCAPCRTGARPYRKPPGRIVAYYAVSWRAPGRCLLALPVTIRFAIL